MAELLVRASLPGFLETEGGENGNDFTRLENGAGGHWLSSYENDLRADRLGLRRRSTVVQEHWDDFPEIAIELVERLALAVRSGKARNMADIQTGVPAALDNGGESVHRRPRLVFMTGHHAS
ncbi:MAG: hypothetical protein OXI87_01615 [Albidovulum sp.]|nr:hypothetical protein [Albidovulum sp.]